MGLLDTFNIDNLDSPGARMGLGLLAAAGPQATPMSFGQRLAGAMGQLRAEKAAEEERKLKAALMNAQIQDMAAQAKLREAQAAKSGEADQLLREVLGAQSAPSQYGMAGGGINLGGVQERMTPRAGGLAGATPEQIALLKLKGIDVTDQWKAAKNGFEQKPGTFYKDATTGETRYQEDPTKGLGYSGGRVSLIPGAAEAQAALSGATKEAEARATGQFDLVQGVDAQGNPTFIGTRTGIADQLRGPQRGSPLDQVRAAMARNGDASAQFDIGGMRGTLQGQAPSAGAGIKTGLGPADKWTYDRERGLMVNELGQTKPIVNEGGQPVGSPKQAEEAKNNNKFLQVVNEARNVLLSGPTASGIGTAVDKGASLFGIAPAGAKEAARLSALSGWLVSNVPRMEGPQSNYDVQNYQTMAGMVGDSRQPISVRMAALEQVEKLIRKYSSLNPAQEGVGLPAASPPMSTSDGWSIKPKGQ